ncbi:endonuclease/exonuclease/phosphatase family protein [Muriicola sp.]|uniref:endonuclease/exonuclease/phosphatase family protein n=1 Tax=Muriicola sp. TaxID=2020856 RepID=UPI0035620B68
MAFTFFPGKRQEDVCTIAFYNLENLFDTRDDPHKLDDDFTPKGFKKWTPKRYRNKLKKLSRTISRLGGKTSAHPPVLVGLAELENKKVIHDLLGMQALRKKGYRFVHYDSPDERGIDTAMLYHPAHFSVTSSKRIPLHVNNTDGKRDATRDILYVKGKLHGEEMHVFVNHWPSRRDGDTATAYKRIKAANTILEGMQSIENDATSPNYIIMGDFNDGPADESIRRLVDQADLHNPMEVLHTANSGSANYKNRWSLFDQILLSKTFFDRAAGHHSFAHARIFDDHLLKEWHGRYKGIPFRTYVGKKYLGGHSDHFPVYVQLRYRKKGND